MQFLTSKRPDLCPIPNFYRQLLFLDQRLHQQFASLYPNEEVVRAKRSEWSIAAVGARAALGKLGGGERAASGAASTHPPTPRLLQGILPTRRRKPC